MDTEMSEERATEVQATSEKDVWRANLMSMREEHGVSPNANAIRAAARLIVGGEVGTLFVMCDVVGVGLSAGMCEAVQRVANLCTLHKCYDAGSLAVKKSHADLLRRLREKFGDVEHDDLAEAIMFDKWLHARRIVHMSPVATCWLVSRGTRRPHSTMDVPLQVENTEDDLQLLVRQLQHWFFAEGSACDRLRAALVPRKHDRRPAARSRDVVRPKNI